jgi:hypothetical protein
VGRSSTRLGSDLDLEVFRTCIPCQPELVELAIELYVEQEAE